MSFNRNRKLSPFLNVLQGRIHAGILGGGGGPDKQKLGRGIPLGPVALTVGVVLGPVLNLSKSFQINCVKRW